MTISMFEKRPGVISLIFNRIKANTVFVCFLNKKGCH